MKIVIMGDNALIPSVEYILQAANLLMHAVFHRCMAFILSSITLLLISTYLFVDNIEPSSPIIEFLISTFQ